MGAETRGHPRDIERDWITACKVEGVERRNDEDFEGIYCRHSQRMYSLCLNQARRRDSSGSREASLPPMVSPARRPPRGRMCERLRDKLWSVN